MYKLAYNNDLTTNAFSCSLPNAVPIDKADKFFLYFGN